MRKLTLALLAVIPLIGVSSALTTNAFAAHGRIVHGFFGSPGDGQGPLGSLISDDEGNLYGTTEGGGPTGAGTVYELVLDFYGDYDCKILHTFTGQDGGTPSSNLVFDTLGNLYGTAGGGPSGYGVVFELSPSGNGQWAEQVLYNFSAGNDGYYPNTGLIFDAAGNLYGTANGGGAYGAGVVYELTKGANGNWTEVLLHTFTGGDDGGNAYGGLIFDGVGNIYGTTASGGMGNYGVVYELTPQGGGQWTETVLHNFTNCCMADGGSPEAGVIFDSSGNLYGTTVYGGGMANAGTIFELAQEPGGQWRETILHRFNGSDGLHPESAVVFDNAGNLLGQMYNSSTPYA
jgi:uncharacterized repeat protein (TIGR03803 family)